jgi:thiamine-phosphate pyrophosphorylase
MKRRQIRVPRQWLIVDGRNQDSFWRATRHLPLGSGVLVLMHDLPKGHRERLLRSLRRVSRLRSLVLIEGDRNAQRVHSMKELRRASAPQPQLILLSPIFTTRSHPGWKPMPRMRAGTLARLATVPVLALGGMNGARFKSVENLGFCGWTGIDAWSP